jgi:hypothetical protein
MQNKNTTKLISASLVLFSVSAFSFGLPSIGGEKVKCEELINAKDNDSRFTIMTNSLVDLGIDDSIVVTKKIKTLSVSESTDLIKKVTTKCASSLGQSSVADVIKESI